MINSKTDIQKDNAPVGGDVDAADKQLSNSHRRSGSLLTKVCTTLVCFVLTIIACEALLALCGLGEEEYIKPDPIFGISHIPGKSVTFKSEGFSRGKLTSAGLRDYEHKLAKAPGVKRIAFLGDSKTEGLQVPLDETFVKVIEHKLNEQKDLKGKYETINFATAGNGTLVELLQYLHTVKDYHPDTTVLVYNYGDSGENGMSGATQNLLARPSASFDTRGALSINFDQLTQWFASDNTRFKLASLWMRTNSRVFQLLTDMDGALRGDAKPYLVFSDSVVKPVCSAIANFVLPQGNGSELLSQKAEPARQTLSAQIISLDKLTPHEQVVPPRPASLDASARSIESVGFGAVDTEYRRNLELTARLIGQLNQACKQNKSRFVVVALPAPDNCTFYFWEIRALQQMAKRQGFEFVDCNATFPKLKPMEPNQYYYTGHLSSIGHKLIADIVTLTLR